jgi:hypothetical protein
MSWLAGNDNVNTFQLMALLLRAQAGSRVAGIHIMQNAIQGILASPPGRLRVVRSGDGVLKVRVSNQNIANVLAVIAAIRLGSSCIFLHSSMAVAQRFFLSLPPYCSEEDEDAVIAFTDKPTTKLTSVAVLRQGGSPGCPAPGDFFYF